MLFHCCSSCPHCPGYHHLARARPAEWGETPETQDTHESQSSCSQSRNPLGAGSSVSSWHPVTEVGYVQPRSTSPCSLAHRFKESDKQPLVFSHLPLGEQACARSHAGELSRVGGRGWSNLHLLTRLSSGTAPRGDLQPSTERGSHLTHRPCLARFLTSHHAFCPPWHSTLSLFNQLPGLHPCKSILPSPWLASRPAVAAPHPATSKAESAGNPARPPSPALQLPAKCQKRGLRSLPGYREGHFSPRGCLQL